MLLHDAENTTAATGGRVAAQCIGCARREATSTSATALSRTSLSPPSNKLSYVLPSALRRPTAALLTVLAITLGGATACGREGSQTDCSLVGCTVTFQRTGTAEISVLGVKAKLVGVEGNSARLEVAGQTVTVPVGGEAATGTVTVRVEQVTDTAVIVRITP